ncbi:MAG: dTDP-4-dehydrorhamnose 3,5-epimerase [Bacteroidales bacterium]|nr:MAG: dTDP-4-dehydrorhamnose 3,5-epimerase [Bacteroidales bacterium]
MKLIETPIPDLFIVEPKVFEDSRGYFLESYSKKLFAENGIDSYFVQDNESKSTKGVLRGLHYQLAPYAQTKLIRVIHGRILDVVVDIRKGSPTFGKHFALELSGDNKQQLFIPKGFAHGFSVLSDYVIVNYKCDALYYPNSERGLLFNDPDLSIDWRIDLEQAIISAKDKVNPPLSKADINFIYGQR